mmetsp:Transcript_38195/g.32314  ORF Transcript_38195/g.32314 Transcript_38195/m.32314 type:complete len:98 (+) Transcript_38195:731-1024(+)
MCGGLDNRSTCYSIINTLYDTANDDDESGITMGVLFDNEEIGSETTQGANSRIQLGTLQRIIIATNIDDPELFDKVTRRSFVISCDAAHAVHPNYPS